MRHVLLLAFLGSWMGCASTGGTETDNPASPLLGFNGSDCKTKALDPGQQALVLASDADGLQCVEWQRSAEGTLALRLLNFPEPCADEYLGRAQLGSDGALELSVYKNICAAAKCGTCLFDFEFQVEVSLDGPLELRIGVAACESQPVMFKDELTLPTDTELTGVVCRALERDALDWDARTRGVCGERNMPCGDCQSVDTTSCAAGLVCSELGAADSRCLESCESDDDCAGGLTRCLDGVCQAEAGF